MSDVRLVRRSLLGLAVALGGSSVLAHTVEKFDTPAQHRGPFYPRHFPQDSDFHLTSVAGRQGKALGENLIVTGQVLDLNGKPLSGAAIEIWQVNGYGRYHHEDDSTDKPLVPIFKAMVRCAAMQKAAIVFEL